MTGMPGGYGQIWKSGRGGRKEEVSEMMKEEEGKFWQ